MTSKKSQIGIAVLFLIVLLIAVYSVWFGIGKEEVTGMAVGMEGVSGL